MGRPGRRRQYGARLWTAVVAVIGAACLAGASGLAAPVDTPRPAMRIPVEPLGFVAPGRFFMPYRIPSATLDFLDADHLLFTFHTAKLMRREADDPKDDADQTIRAVVLSLPGGKVQAEGTWRMHDRDRYLWVLGDGRFLMRQRNTLYLGDSSLALSVYLHPEGSLVSAQLSPGGSTLVAEYANPVEEAAEGDRAPASIPTLGPSLNSGLNGGDNDLGQYLQKRKVYTLLVVNTRTRTADRLGHLAAPLIFPMVEGGYLGVTQSIGKQWNVELSSFGGKPSPVVTIPSTCQPLLSSLSEHAFLAQTCLPYLSDHLMQAYDLHGHKLWEQMWQSRFAWGTFAYSGAGNRVAYGSVEVNHNLATLDPVEEGAIVGQPVGIFSIATGKLDTVLDANPILTAGNNFALSPDGDKLAILRNGAIEVFDLPPVTAPPAAAAGSK